MYNEKVDWEFPWLFMAVNKHRAMHSW